MYITHLRLEVVPALHDHKHVIDAEAEHEEGQDGVHGAVRQAHGRAQAEGHAHRQVRG